MRAGVVSVREYVVLFALYMAQHTGDIGLAGLVEVS